MNRLWLSAVLVVVCLAFALPAGATEYYVSPSGNDVGGNGSQGRPWRTIQKAADKMSAGDTCHVMDGNYDEMVRPARSGAAGHYISFVAEGQSVWLNGTRHITGWTAHSGNIWRASAAWDFGELFVDRQRMVLARWPNLTSGDVYRPDFYQATANGGDTSLIDSVHLTQPSGYWSGAKIFMVPGLGWIADQRDVTGYDPANHQITFSSAISFAEYYDADEYSLYFLYDMLSLLDAPSEWFLDRAEDTVYLWLPGGGNPSGHLVEASGWSGGFDLTDRSYIRVAGFKLMSGDIKMLNATGCLVEGVRHLYPTTELSVSGSDNVITRSEIAYAGYSGVRLAGTRNTLSKCHVHHCDYLGKAVPEFTGSNSIVVLGVYGPWPPVVCSQNSIVDCSLHDDGRDVVSTIGGQKISTCVIEHNEIYNAGLIAKDCGGIYSGLTDGRGTVICYNIVHDIWPKQSLQYGTFALGNGIYLDNSSSDFSVHHNVVYRTAANAICLNQPSQNILVYNNTAVGSGGGWGDVIRSNSMSPELAGVDGTVVANNLAVMLDDRLGLGSPFGWCIEFDRKAPDYHHNGYYNLMHSNQLNNQGVESTGVTGNPLFANAAGNDFSLLAGSPMIDKGVVIPGITDGYVGSAPDIGAYELGGSELPGPRDQWWLPETIAVASPNGGESWQAGTTHDIIWSSTGLISDVKIELSFNGGDLWSTIIASTPNDGSYLWDIGTTPSLGCVMRISDVLGTASDTSDAMFVLTSPPSLTNNYFILPVKWTDTPFGSGGWYVGDYDGDGRSDLLRYVLDGTRNEVLLSTGSAFAAGSNWLTAEPGADGWHVGDFNGDGRSDLMRYVPGVSGADVFLSNGTQFNYAGNWSGAGNGSDGWYVGDFNGDGRDDIMRYVPGVSGADVFLSDGTKFNYSGNWSGAGNGADGWYVGDFNGDGRSDLMRYNPGVSGGEVFLSDGTKFDYNGSWTGAGNGDNGWYLGKFSGTARTDIMRYVLLLSGADVFLNTGAGFTYDGSWTPAGRGDNDWHVGDFNGDGRDDLMRSIVGVTGADVLLSTMISGSSSSAAPMAIQANRGKARWLNDVPVEKSLSVEELTLLEGIKARMAAGEEITIYQVQREYEMLTGKLLTRAGIMKLLKRQQWDSIYKLKAEDLLQ